MSLQDDFFDIEEKLKGTTEAKAFGKIYRIFGQLEVEVDVLSAEVRRLKVFEDSFLRSQGDQGNTEQGLP